MEAIGVKVIPAAAARAVENNENSLERCKQSPVIRI